MGLKKRDILEVFEEIHHLDRNIELVNKEVQITQQVIRHLSNKAKSEEEYVQLEITSEKEIDLRNLIKQLNVRRAKAWVEISDLNK